MRFRPPRTWFFLVACIGLACAVSAVIGCGGSTSPAAPQAEAKPVPTAVVKGPAAKVKTKLKNVSPLGELGVRELRALKKAQQAQQAGQE